MKVIWDAESERLYSSGIYQGVLYPGKLPGVAWNGLISVSEGTDGDENTGYLDGRAYRRKSLPNPFAGTISAYTYPDELELFTGISGILTGQPVSSFGLSYRTNNEIHLVYNVTLAPSKRDYVTLSEQINPIAMEWDFTTQPVKIPGGKPSSHIVIMINDSAPAAISDLEAVIYGNDSNDPSLPPPEDVLAIFESHVSLRITDNGDGSWTADDPDGTIITIIDADTFQINWPSVIFIPEDLEFLQSWDFETGVTGCNFWGGGTSAGVITQDSTWSKNGSYSCLLTTTVQGTGMNAILIDIMTPSEGDFLTVIFTVHAPAALNGCDFGTDWKRADNGLLESSRPAEVQAMNFAADEERTISFISGPAPANTARATFIFNMPDNSPAGTSMAIDDVTYAIRKPSTTYRISSL